MSKLIHQEWPNYGGDLDDVVWLRIKAAIEHEEGDRVPIWDYIDNRYVVEHFSNPGDAYEDAMVKVYHGLGIDLCRGYGSSYTTNDNGRVNDEHTNMISGQTSWITKHRISNYDDLATYQHRLFTDTDCENWVKGWKAFQRRLAPLTYGVPGMGVGFDDVYSGLMGQTLFSYAIYDRRSDLERIFEQVNYNAVRIAETAAREKIGPIFFTWSDIAYKDRLLWSPQFLRETFIPMLRRVCEPVNNAGLTVIFHSDGDVTEILDDMVDAGINGLNPIEPIAGMDIGAIKKRYGDNLVLVGNIDCSQVLPLGTPETIREAVKDTLRQAGHGGGLFIGSSSEIVPATPLENVLAFFEACREYGRYPLQV